MWNEGGCQGKDWTFFLKQITRNSFCFSASHTYTGNDQFMHVQLMCNRQCMHHPKRMGLYALHCCTWWPGTQPLHKFGGCLQLKFWKGSLPSFQFMERNFKTQVANPFQPEGRIEGWTNLKLLQATHTSLLHAHTCGGFLKLRAPECYGGATSLPRLQF